MRVCHLTSAHSPNDIRIFIKQCNTLSKNNFDVHYIVPETKTYKVDGITIHGVEGNKKSRLQRMLFVTKEVYKKALEINADVYHFHDPELIPIGLKLKRKGKKVIYDVHEDTPRAILSKKYIKPFLRKITSKMFELYENYTAGNFDYIICATPHISERFLKINKNTITINNYPITRELFSSDKNEWTDRKQICYIGAFSPIRGSEVIIKAATNFKRKLLVAGKVTDKVKEDMLNHPNIRYLGSIDRNEVKELLNGSIAGLVTFLPEPNHINAQPNKMFEYMSAGIPVVASNFPLWREIIETAKCGICVDPEKPNEIANAVNYLINNPSEAEKMGKKGREAIEKKYNWDYEGEKLVNVYNYLSK